MQLVDTHCHLDFDRFDEDRDAVIGRAVEAGIVRMITIGIDAPTNANAIALAEQHDAIYATVGIHPNSVDRSGSLTDAIAALRELAAHPKVVAIGECGLDYYWDKSPHEVQAAWFRAQLDLAAEVSLPVVIHNRDSTADLLALLHEWRTDHTHPLPGVLHSFSGTWEAAQQALEMGFMLGITGPVSYKNGEENRRIAKQMPADRMLIETDAPFLTPQPRRGKRNEPAYVRFVAETIAGVRAAPLEEVAAQTTANADRLFSLNLPPQTD